MASEMTFSRSGSGAKALSRSSSLMNQPRYLKVGGPKRFSNPVGTTIRFCVPQGTSGPPAVSRLVIHNLAGQAVAALVDGELPAGAHEVRWDARDLDGRDLASGVYLCRLQVGSQTETRRLLLLR